MSRENGDTAIRNASHKVLVTLSFHGLNCQILNSPVPNPLQEAEIQIQEDQIVVRDSIDTSNADRPVALMKL